MYMSLPKISWFDIFYYNLYYVVGIYHLWYIINE